MGLYLNKAAVIIDLHQRGFTEDFQVAGDEVLWVQRKLFLKPKDFSWVEAHRFIGRDGSDILVVGASLLSHYADGIFISQFKHVFNWRPALINKKVKELMANLPVLDNHVNQAEFCISHLQ